MTATEPVLSEPKRTAHAWVDDHRNWLSRTTRTIWDFHEPAWREYRSAAHYVRLLHELGFEVEEGTAGMPTAFRASFGSGRPVLGAYAEYDAVPGNSQEAVPYRKPRDGVHEQAAGHTDPHSALGTGALGGVLAAKQALERHGLAGTLVLFGEPAEKVCGSKPIHAAHGYYDDLDAAISFHPAWVPSHANTVYWDTHCGSYWSAVYTFECPEPEGWAGIGAGERSNPHTSARAPGAIDAVTLMYTSSKLLKEAMLPHTGTWTVNEAILAAGQATADNEPPRFAQIQYASRAPTLEMQERVFAVLDRNAEHAAAMTQCTMRKGWVSKTRPGLPNHGLAELTYANLELAGPPAWDDEAREFGREIQRSLGIEPMADPLLPRMAELLPPQRYEDHVRGEIPPWQTHYTSDDYTEYTWHTPTARLYVGRCLLDGPDDLDYPAWVFNATGGHPATIDPTVVCAAKTIAGTLVDLLTTPVVLERARTEFNERTGGGIGGSAWLAPLLPGDFAAPIQYRWPEYVTTARGEEWWIPTGA
jgi:aminobenzoyl-glutamate utilization protein B